MRRSKCAAIAAESYPSPDSGEEMAGVSTSRSQRDSTKKEIEMAAWNAVKEDIAELYLDKNLCLKEVMSKMETEHGFFATEKQYKNTLKGWLFWKNNRKEDVANIAAEVAARKAQGKETEILRHGRLMNLGSYLKRTHTTMEELVKMGRRGALPPGVECRTPLLSPRALRLPDDCNLRYAYLHWTHGHPLLPPHIDADYFCELDRYHQSEAVYAVGLFTHACWLFTIGKADKGGAFCESAFQRLSKVLDRSAQFAIYELMGVVERYPLKDMNRMLWGYLAEWAKLPNKADEKVRRMLVAFARFAQTAGFDDSVAMLQWGRQMSSQQSNGTFDGKPFDYTLIKPWDVLPMNRAAYHRYYMNRVAWKAEMIPTATLTSPEKDPDPWPLRADLLVIFGNQTGWNDDAIEGTAIKMLNAMPRDRRPGYPEFVCFYALAQMYRQRCLSRRCSVVCDHSLARRYLEWAAQIQYKAWRPGKNYYETLTLLEKWHFEAGDFEAARATRKHRDETCQVAFENLYL